MKYLVFPSTIQLVGEKGDLGTALRGVASPLGEDTGSVRHALLGVEVEVDSLPAELGD